MAVFGWLPSFTPTLRRAPRVLVAQYGDGYLQRIGDGINTSPAVWDLKFSARSTTTAAAIMAFLDSAAGVQSFDWTDPNGASGKYICRKYGGTRTSPLLHTVTATFDQVFDL